MRFTFKKGIHPKDNKQQTMDIAFENMPVGDKVFIPLVQHIGKPAQPIVKVGDKVKVGTLIAQADGHISANIHSSVSGKVLAFDKRENLAGNKIDHIVIENDGEYKEDFLPPLINPTAEDIIKRSFDAGIVGMGGATFPTHVKLQTKNKIDMLIINGAECEPYLSTDYRMMVEFPEKVLEGVEYLRLALGAQEVAIGIEDNKPNAITAMANNIKYPNTKVYKLLTKYPQGGEKQLIYAISKRKVPDGGLPADIGIIVFNISSAFAMYEAVKYGKPCISRHITVSGGGVARPSNIYARIGIPFQEIIDHLGHNDNYVKAISGGPMMGTSISNLMPVISKGSSALLLLTEKEIRKVEPSACINCAKCHMVCPINLMPMMTDTLILANKIEEAKKYHPMSCIECGCCAYVCPAKRPLVQSQRLAKKMIREKG